MRRRSTPWIHRWSRPIMGAIALVGAIETAYLTIVKLAGGSAVCPTSGCDQVLNSAYASIFGIPITIFGFLAYVTMGVLALAPLTINPETNKGKRLKWDETTWLLLFLGGTAMLVGSAYLMYILAYEIKVFCPYCVASALFSLSLFVLALIGHEWEDFGQIIFNGIIVGMITLITILALYSGITPPSSIANNQSSNQQTTSGNSPAPTTEVAANEAPPITTSSGPAEIALAKHLTSIGAKEYGAYWCPHCHEQKLLFGKEAAELLDYVECDPKGKNSRTELCKKANIEGFPTWEIQGKLYVGTQSLEKLAKISGYTGKRDFLNTLPNQPKS